MARRTKEQRREDYLAIGAELVAEAATVAPPDPGLALAHVKVADVAERAGVTKGALYHLWPSQEDYWHDLLLFLFEHDRLLGETAIADQADDLRAAFGSDDPGDLIEHANLIFDLVKDDPAFLVRLGIFSYLYDEDVRARLDREYRAGVARFNDFLAWGLDQLGLRLRDGVSLEQYTVALISLLQGTILEYRIHPDRTPDAEVDGRRVTLFAAGAIALTQGFTEPVDAGKGR
jgi:AcrR family transcriptional regulator